MIISAKRLLSSVFVSALAITIFIGLPVNATDAKTPPNYATGKGCTAYVYGKGGSSTCIKYIQMMLNGINNFYVGYGGNGVTINGKMLSEDGQFGSLTEGQVKIFQKWVYLKGDGIIGKNTWEKLCHYSGQVSFWYPGEYRENRAWNAAYSAGCYVEYQTSDGSLKWKSRY